MATLPPIVHLSQLDSSPEARQSLCDSLKEFSFAVVALDGQSAAGFSNFRSHLRNFFALETAEKEKLGPFRRLGGRMFGYRLDEVHACRPIPNAMLMGKSLPLTGDH